MQSREPVNILLVDDRPDGLLAMEAVLKSPDHRLVQASSGKEALECVQKEDFAVILLDVQMPHMDGFQTASHIIEIDRSKNTPIIFVTAINKDPFYIYQGYTLGAVDYIFKPFDPKILLSKVSVFVNLFRQQNYIRRQTEEIQRKEYELFQARKLEAIGRLAGGVAHDFNNLITGILGLSQDVRNTLAMHDARREDLDEILKAGNRALSLTKQLLAFGRRQIISPRIVDVNAVVLDMTRMLKRLIGEDIELATLLGAGLRTVKVEPSHVEQIILNLALNARDAMPKGGTVSISTANMDVENGRSTLDGTLPHGSYVLLQVADTGKGMDTEMMNHIFEPYYTTKEKERGTGLGLATVYGVVKQCDGHIDVQSQPGRGTSFHIYLPHVAGTLEPTPKEPSDAYDWKGQETILVVEDEDIVRRVAKRALTQHGYTVFAARDGKEALALVDDYEGVIDLLVTDVLMPGMNGRQLAKILLRKLPQMAVLYMSGYSEDVVMQRGHLDPDIAFIEKSFTAQQLALKAREVIDRQRTQHHVTAGF